MSVSLWGTIKTFLKGMLHAEGNEQHLSGRERRKSAVLHRIPAVCDKAVSDLRDIGMLARACAAERGRDPGSGTENPICRESRALIAAAKSVGSFVDASSVPGTRYTIRSGESEVRLDQKNRIYYKIKNPFAKLHLKGHPVECVLFEHVVHNILFPECRLEFQGVSEDCHEARLVFRQNAVRSIVRPDDRQIAAALRDLGLSPEGRYGFGNACVFVTDVGQDGDNVLVDTSGLLRFIDPIVGIKEPLRELLESGMVMPAVSGVFGLSEDEVGNEMEMLRHEI